MAYQYKSILSKKILILLFLIVLYKITIEILYVLIIHKVWFYRGFGLDFDLVKYIESWILFLGIFILMPKRIKASVIVVYIMFLTSFVPMLSIFALNNESRLFMYAVVLFWTIVNLILYLPSVKILRFNRFQGKMLIGIISIVNIIAVLLLIDRHYELSISFDLANVYAVRAGFKAVDISYATYLFNWCGLYVNPILFVLLMKNKRWFYLGFSIFLQLLLFWATGNKIYIFVFPLAAALVLSLRFRWPLLYMCGGLFGLVVFGAIVSLLYNNNWITSLFLNRVLFLPSILAFNYYDFFTENQFLFLSHHKIFNMINTYPYELAPPNLIGQAFFNRPEENANNGILSDAYMNFGYIGIVLWAIFLGFLLKVYDSFSRNKDIRYVVVIAGITAIILENTPLLTSFLTNGVLIGLIFLYIIPEDSNLQKVNNSGKVVKNNCIK